MNRIVRKGYQFVLGSAAIRTRLLESGQTFVAKRLKALSLGGDLLRTKEEYYWQHKIALLEMKPRRPPIAIGVPVP